MSSFKRSAALTACSASALNASSTTFSGKCDRGCLGIGVGVPGISGSFGRKCRGGEEKLIRLMDVPSESASVSVGMGICVAISMSSSICSSSSEGMLSGGIRIVSERLGKCESCFGEGMGILVLDAGRGGGGE